MLDICHSLGTMSFAQTYHLFLIALMAFGIYPIIFNTHTKLFKRSKLCLIYVIILNISITALLIVIIGFRTAHNLYEPNKIHMLSNLLQSSINEVMQVSMITYCLWTSRDHVQFLNDILKLDQKINSTLQRTAINDQSFMKRHILETISFFIAYLLVLYFVDRTIHKFEPHWFNIAWKKISSQRVAVQLMPVLHIRFCALLLRNRLRIVSLELHKVNVIKFPQMYYSAVMQLFDDLCELKCRFERIFGFVILTNAMHDLLTGTVLVYMSIVNVLEQNEPQLFLLSISMFILIISKQAMYVSPVNELNENAQKLRIVQTWNTNFVRLEKLLSVKSIAEEKRYFLIFYFFVS